MTNFILFFSGVLIGTVFSKISKLEKAINISSAICLVTITFFGKVDWLRFGLIDIAFIFAGIIIVPVIIYIKHILVYLR